MASINDNIENWASISGGHQFIKNDIVKYHGYFWYALKDHVKSSSPGSPDEPDTGSGSEYWGGVITLQNNKKIPFFIWVASYTSTVQHKPLVTTIRFGNGYEQRISKSFNPDLKVLQFNFDQRTEHEARAIVHFFKERAGTKSFAFNPPGIYADTTYKTRFVCREWESNFTFKENYSIRAKMEEIAG
jgi:phage-related protein